MVLTELRWSLRELARRIHTLDDQLARLDQRLTPLVARAAPALIGMVGIGVHTAAQLLVTFGDNPDRIRPEAAFGHLCGVAPIPASSVNTTRHHLDRGGDRHANSALHQAVLVRMSCEPDTRDYRHRAVARGKTERDAMRLLKRYLARHVYWALVNPPDDRPPTGPQLRAPADRPRPDPDRVRPTPRLVAREDLQARTATTCSIPLAHARSTKPSSSLTTHRELQRQATGRP